MTQVIVLGMHSSGTSMTAAILHELGIFMGDGLLEAHHYEDMAAANINRRILLALGASWQKPPSAEAIAAETAQDDRIARFVAKRDAAHEVWGFKDPMTCLTVSHWASAMPEAKYIRVRRETADVIASLKRRNPGMEDGWYGALVGTYCERAAEFLGGRRYLSVEYERACRERDWIVGQLAGYVGVEPNDAAVALIRAKE